MTGFDTTTADLTIGGTSLTSTNWSAGTASGSGVGPYNFTITRGAPNKDGNLTFQIAGGAGHDGLGNNSSASNMLTFLIDTTPPTVVINSNPTNPSNSSSASFSFTATDPTTGLANGVSTGINSIQCQLDGSGYSVCTSSKVYSGLSDGSHTFNVLAVDGAGNTGLPATYTWTIDTTAPVLTFTAPVGDTTQSSTSVNVTWTESDTGSGLNAVTRSIQRLAGVPIAGSCSGTSFLNDGTATSAASPRLDTGLSNNTCYEWTGSISDNAGNPSVVATSGTVLISSGDTTTSLALTSGTNPSTYGDSLTFTATVTSGGGNPSGVGSVTFYDGGVAFGSCTTVVLSGNTASCTLSSLAAGDHNLTASYSGSLPTFNPSTSAILGQHVNKRALDVTATDQSKTYGNLFTFTGSEFSLGAGQLVVANGDSVTSVTLTSAGTPVSATVVPGSPYAITPSAALGSGLANYDIQYHNAPTGLTVNRAVLTVTADNKIKFLHAANPVFTATISGFVLGQTLATSGVTGSPICNSTATTASPIGSYPITCTIGTLSSANYTFAFVGGTLTIDYVFAGFLQPINDTGHSQTCGNPCPVSIFKGGSTIPVKFVLTDANGVVVQ
ncbi:MAG: MBG domain-containing protein, partial [Minisyncoccia bacterium]